MSNMEAALLWSLHATAHSAYF